MKPQHQVNALWPDMQRIYSLIPFSSACVPAAALPLSPGDPLSVRSLPTNTLTLRLWLILLVLQKFLPFPFFFTSWIFVAQLKSYFLLCGLIKLHVTFLPVHAYGFFVHTAYSACKYVLLQQDAKFPNLIFKSLLWKSWQNAQENIHDVLFRYFLFSKGK